MYLQLGVSQYINNIIQIFHCFKGNIPYQNVCPEVHGNPRDVIFPDAFGVGKYNISGIPGNRGTNVLVYFPRSNEITVTLHLLVKTLEKWIRNSRGNVTPADSRDVTNNVACTVMCLSLFQSDILSIPKISAVNITFAVTAMSGQYNVTQYLACLCICEVKTVQNILRGFL